MYGIDRLLSDDGVTYRAHGSQLQQPWAVDPIPLILDETEWAEVEAGVRQRAELLDLVLTDLYGPRDLLSAGLLPPEVVYGHAGFIRAVDGVRLPRARQLFLSASDLARDADGQWRVIADRTRAPFGAGYAMENRRGVSQALPGLYRDSQIQRLNPFFQTVLGVATTRAPAERHPARRPADTGRRSCSSPDPLEHLDRDVEPLTTSLTSGYVADSEPDMVQNATGAAGLTGGEHVSDIDRLGVFLQWGEAAACVTE